MTASAPHAKPPLLGTVAREQFGAVGTAIRRDAAVVALLVLVPSVAALLVVWRRGATLPFGSVEDLTVLGWLTAAAAFLAPVVVWKGEEAFGSSPLWWLPVGHRPHALIKVAAGGAWLLITLGTVLLWLLLVALATGGSLGVEETRLVLDPSDPSGVRSVSWLPPLWQWIGPFTAAVAIYLLASAVHLGTRHPWWWIAGTAFLVALLSVVAPESGAGWLRDAWAGASHHLTAGPYGLDALLTGGAESLESIHRLPSGEQTIMWRLPTFGRWAGATLVWTALGLIALLAATSRRRDG